MLSAFPTCSVSGKLPWSGSSGSCSLKPHRALWSLFPTDLSRSGSSLDSCSELDASSCRCCSQVWIYFCCKFWYLLTLMGFTEGMEVAGAASAWALSTHSWPESHLTPVESLPWLLNPLSTLLRELRPLAFQGFCLFSKAKMKVLKQGSRAWCLNPTFLVQLFPLKSKICYKREKKNKWNWVKQPDYWYSETCQFEAFSNTFLVLLQVQSSQCFLNVQKYKTGAQRAK